MKVTDLRKMIKGVPGNWDIVCLVKCDHGEQSYFKGTYTASTPFEIDIHPERKGVDIRPHGIQAREDSKKPTRRLT